MSNETEWIVIHKTKSQFEAEALKGNLETNGIPAVVMDKKDHAVANTVGYIEVHVDATKKDAALELIKGFDTKA